MSIDPLLLLDSFMHYSQPQGITKYTTNYTGTLVSGKPTGSGYALSEGNASVTLPAGYTTLCAHGRRYVAGAGNIFHFTNPFGDGIGVYCNVIGDGRIRVDLFCGAAPFGSGGQQAYSDFSIAFGSDYHFQFKFTGVANIIGPGFYQADWTYEVRINGVTRLSGVASSPNGGANVLHFPATQFEINSHDENPEGRTVDFQ